MFYRPGSVRPMWPKPVRGKSEKKTGNLVSEFKRSQTQGGIQYVHRARTQETFT